jgi:hypothetical protein
MPSTDGVGVGAGDALGVALGAATAGDDAGAGAIAVSRTHATARRATSRSERATGCTDRVASKGRASRHDDGHRAVWRFAAY